MTVMLQNFKPMNSCFLKHPFFTHIYIINQSPFPPPLCHLLFFGWKRVQLYLPCRLPLYNNYIIQMMKNEFLIAKNRCDNFVNHLCINLFESLVRIKLFEISWWLYSSSLFLSGQQAGRQASQLGRRLVKRAGQLVNRLVSWVADWKGAIELDSWLVGLSTGQPAG